jgi:predicted lipoprotein with Yx(FWY)xxD motif
MNHPGDLSVLAGEERPNTEAGVNTMQKNRQNRGAHHRAALARWAGALVAVGGISLSVLASEAGAASAVTVSTTKNAKMGTILVSGKTLYTLKPSSTACTAACLKVWPALVLPTGVTKAKAGSGVTASKLGTVKRNGVVQVTYGGKPLYFFTGDSAAGQVNGVVTDTWGKWTAVVTKKAAGSGSSSNSGSSNSSAGGGGAAF